MSVVTTPVLVLVLLILGFACYLCWDGDRHLQRKAELEAAEYEAEMEARYHAPRAVDVASSGIYDWRKSGL